MFPPPVSQAPPGIRRALAGYRGNSPAAWECETGLRLGDCSRDTHSGPFFSLEVSAPACSQQRGRLGETTAEGPTRLAHTGRPRVLWHSQGGCEGRGRPVSTGRWERIARRRGRLQVHRKERRTPLTAGRRLPASSTDRAASQAKSVAGGTCLHTQGSSLRSPRVCAPQNVRGENFQPQYCAECRKTAVEKPAGLQGRSAVW